MLAFGKTDSKISFSQKKKTDSVDCSTDIPGTTATVLRARKTLKVLSAARLPRGNAIVMYLYS